MRLSELLKQLRVESGLPQRKVAASLDIDTATYCKFEKGTLRPRREQLPIMAELFNTQQDKLLTLWLSDQITKIIGNDKNLAKDVLKETDNNLTNNQ